MKGLSKKELWKAYSMLMYKAVKMRCELHTLAKDINSDESKAILAEYRKKIEIERENKLVEEN